MVTDAGKGNTEWNLRRRAAILFKRILGPLIVLFFVQATMGKLHPPFLIAGLTAVTLVIALEVQRRAGPNRRTRATITAWLLFALMFNVPFEVTLTNAPGPPRFVPIAYGFPGPEMAAAAKRGEIELGGCVVPIGWPIFHCRGYWVW